MSRINFDNFVLMSTEEFGLFCVRNVVGLRFVLLFVEELNSFQDST